MAKQSNLAKKEFYGYRILSVTEIRNESNITFGLTAEVLPAIKIGSQDESFYTNQIKIKVVCLKALIIRWAGFRPELAQTKNLRKVLFHYGKEYCAENSRQELPMDFFNWFYIQKSGLRLTHVIPPQSI